MPTLQETNDANTLRGSPIQGYCLKRVGDGVQHVIRGVSKDFFMLINESKTLLNLFVVADPSTGMTAGFKSLESVQACIDMRNHTVTITARDKKSISDLDYDELYYGVESCKTSTADFRSSSEIYPSLCRSESDEERRFLWLFCMRLNVVQL